MYCTVIFNSKTHTFGLESDISYDKVTDFIIEWMKTDIIEGPDNKEIKEMENYWVSIYNNGRKYEVEDNCENRDLRRGILGFFIKDYKNIRKLIKNKGYK